MTVSMTHYGHACLHLRYDDASLLFDPGSYSDGYLEVVDLSAICITHAHQDHFDLEALEALRNRHPEAPLFVDEAVGEQLVERSIPHEVMVPGTIRSVAGIELRAVGGRHEQVHPEVPCISNIGFLVEEGAFYHPGDALHVPDAEVESLGLPTAGPWLKAGEAVDFLRAVGPRVAVPIHQAVLARPQSHYRLFDTLRPSTTELRVVEPGVEVQLA